MKNVTQYIFYGPAVTPRECPSVVSRESIAILVIMLLISACSRGLGIALDSIRTESGEKARSVSAAPAGREKISLEGVLLRPDGSLSPNSAPIIDSAAEILHDKP
jgi:hypothetical protein